MLFDILEKRYLRLGNLEHLDQSLFIYKECFDNFSGHQILDEVRKLICGNKYIIKHAHNEF